MNVAIFECLRQYHYKLAQCYQAEMQLVALCETGTSTSCRHQLVLLTANVAMTILAVLLLVLSAWLALRLSEKIQEEEEGAQQDEEAFFTIDEFEAEMEKQRLKEDEESEEEADDEQPRR